MPLIITTNTYNKLRVLIINKDVRKSLARKNVNESPIWSWNDSQTTLTSGERSPYGYWQQDLQQYHVWTTIQDNQQTWREMPICVHSWSLIPRWHIQNQNTSTYKTKSQPSNMGGIHRPSQGPWRLKSHVTYRHTRLIWRNPKTLLSNQTHVKKA